MENVKVFKYQEKEIEFDLDSELYVNATEMAALFGKDVYEFLRLESTQRFVKHLETKMQESVNSTFVTGISPVVNSDISPVRTFKGGRQKGTWIHRRLALKFAAYLSVEFEDWVFETIENILFEQAAEQRDATETLVILIAEHRRVQARLAPNQDYQKLVLLESEIQSAKNRQSRRMKHRVQSRVKTLFDS